MISQAALTMAQDFAALSVDARLMEANVTALILDHRECLPKVAVRVGSFGDEAEMLQLGEELFLRVHKGGFFRRVGGGSSVRHVAERINLFDGRAEEDVGGILRFLMNHDCRAGNGSGEEI